MAASQRTARLPTPAVTPTLPGVPGAAISSSVMVSVTAVGAATPARFCAVADTVTLLLPVYAVSLTAVTRTRPVLAVVPGAISRRMLALWTKSAAVAGDTAVAVTVTVVGASEARSRRAVTVAAVRVPLSAMVAGVSTSVARGAVSFSVRVSVTFAGASTPRPPAAVAPTVTDLSAAWTVLSTAAMVTVPVLAVAPAAIVSVAPVNVKSPAAAPVPGAAVTVRVVASLDGWLRPAVTVVLPPFSAIVAGVNVSVAVGVGSSSVMVRLAPVTAPMAWALLADAVTVTARSGASTVLFSATMPAVSAAFSVAPAGMTMVASVPGS